MQRLRASQRLTCRLLTSFSLAGFLTLCGCNVGPRYHAPAMPAPPEYKEVVAEDGTRWKPLTGNTALPEPWWEIYKDPQLNTLEAQVNLSNQTIAAAYQNLQAARAIVREAHTNLYPSVNFTPSYTRSHAASSFTGNGANPNSNLFTAPIDVNWEVDLWGRLRNQVRVQANAAQVSAADLAAQQLAQQSALATYLFELRGQDALIDLYQRTVSTDQDALKVTQARYKYGLDNEETVAQAQITLRSAEAALTNTRIVRAQFEHAVALVVGQPASTFSLPVQILSNEPPTVPIGVPSELLKRRPDVSAAERTVAEANALIGVGKAAYYPTLTLSGSGGVQSNKASQWFQWPNHFFAVGPTLSQNIFDSGLRRATVAQYTATYNANIANYRQTVLVAFQQTEDALVATRLLQTERAEEQQTVEAAQNYYNLASIRYKTGLDPFLNVFTAQQTLLANQQSLVLLQTQQMTQSVQLIQVLGGGWDVAKLPTERQVARK